MLYLLIIKDISSTTIECWLYFAACLLHITHTMNKVARKVDMSDFSCIFVTFGHLTSVRNF